MEKSGRRKVKRKALDDGGAAMLIIERPSEKSE